MEFEESNDQSHHFREAASGTGLIACPLCHLKASHLAPKPRPRLTCTYTQRHRPAFSKPSCHPEASPIERFLASSPSRLASPSSRPPTEHQLGSSMGRSECNHYIGLGAQGAGVAAFVTTVLGYTLVYVRWRDWVRVGVGWEEA